MKKVYEICAILMACVAVSCQKDETKENAVFEPVMRTFTCTIDSAADPDSKMSIDAEGKTKWVSGDKILVHGEYIGTKSGKKYSTVIELGVTEGSSISSDGKTATFTVATDVNGVAGIVPYDCRSSKGYYSQLFACYPAEAAVQTNEFHTYYYSVFNDCSKPLLAAYDKNDSFVFKQIGSIVSFSLPDSEDFNQYVLEGNNEETISYDQYSVRVVWKNSGSEQTDIPHSEKTVGPKKTISGSVTCDGSTHMIFIPGSVVFTKGFTLSLGKDGNLLKSVSTSKEVDFSKPGKLLQLGNIKDYLHTYVHTPATWTASAVDWTASPANSYIVYAADAGKAFKIKAVKGNGDIGIGLIASVDIVWETYNNATSVTAKTIVEKVDYSGDNQYVFFKLPNTFHAGNALIAAKNAAGDILWSWHIWAPETAITTITDATVFGDKAIMDRNLGALAAASASGPATVESYGMFYQWGRKDPFPGMDAVLHDGKAAVAGTSMSVVEGTYTIDEAIKNPTKFARSADEKDWVTVDGGQSNELWNSTKTIFDPCPSGYIVPTRNKSVHYWGDTKFNSLPAEDHFADNGSTNGSYVIGTGTLVVFPFTGYIQMAWGDHYKSGKRSYIWSSYASSYGDNIDKAYAVYAKSVLDSSTSYEYRRVEKGKCLGASVRCVAE